MSILADREPRITIHRSPYIAEQMPISEACARGLISTEEMLERINSGPNTAATSSSLG